MTTISAPHLTEVICWTRIQTEAGQDISSIIARKEAERRAGDGLFFWGVGNAPNRSIRRFAIEGRDVDVVFSLMKGRPSVRDSSPAAVAAWSTFFDQEGVERPLPPHAIVTSRMEVGARAKSAHYALVCRSEEELAMGDLGAFDPGAYRNVGERGGPVGNSQVTALVVRTRAESAGSGYRVNLRAKLAGGYWVKLGRPRLLGASDLTALADASARAAEMGVGEWLSVLAAIKAGAFSPDARQMLLF